MRRFVLKSNDERTPEMTVETGIIIAALIGLLTWILKDWIMSGRVKQGIYLTTEAFEKHTANCCAIRLKKDFHDCQNHGVRFQSTVETKVEDMETRLEQGRIEFKQVASDISDIKSSIAVMVSSIGRIDAELATLRRERV
jgi:hypothetical protein